MARAWSLAILLPCTGAFRRAISKPPDVVPSNGSRVVPLAVVPDAEDMEPFVFDDHDTDVAKAGAEVSSAMLAPALDTNIESCGCRYGRYSYQVWPLNQAGGGCVGGCGGSEFQINRFGATIKQMTVWTKSSSMHSHIKAIRFTYHDNHAIVKGDPVGGGGPHTFTFGPGEYVVGDVALSGNGVGTRLGSIRFQTSQGNVFDVGMRDPYRYLFPSGGSYITGFMGRSGGDIDMLGFVFWKPITGISYESLTYPTLHTLTRLTSPARVEARTYCNNLPVPMPVALRTVSKEVTVGHESCLESSSSVQFSKTMTVSGGIPLVKEASATASWEVSTSLNINNCESYSETNNETIEFPGMDIPANTRFEYTWSQWAGTLNALPFTAVLVISMNDGSSFRRTETGTYTGVSFNDIHQSYDNWDDNVTTCR